MEQKIVLTPKQVSELTGLSLEKCVSIVYPNTARSAKELEKLSKCPFELNDLILFPIQGSIIIKDGECMLRQVIKGVNESFTNFLRRFTTDNTAIKKIELTDKVQAYLPILTPENRKKLYEFLADRHRLTYGVNTKEYKNYELLTSNNAPVCAYQ